MTTDVVDIGKSINEFGILVIIGAVFIYAAIRTLNLVFEYFQDKFKNKKHDELLEKRTEIDSQVQEMLDKFLEHYGGNRIHVIEFSNSVMSVAYLPFRYMSCTYECYSVGKNAAGSKIDHLSTSLFTTFFNNLNGKDYCIFDTSNKDMKLGGAMYDIMTECNETRALCTLMKSHTGKNIGYIALYKDGDFRDDEIEDIQSLSDRVSALLSVTDKQTTK